jgi:hypothetical protein
MIGWTNPGALWALVIAGAPVIIHLLRRHRAARIPFPSLRFVRSAESSAVRLRWPSDAWLLLLRVAALGLAVCAIAGPVVLTESRLARWNERAARAIVVDSSASMTVRDADGVEPARLADEAAQAEARSTEGSVRIDAADVREGLRQAVAWLSSSPPARREIVIITDSQRGTLDNGTLRRVPEAIGIRITSIGRSHSSRTIDGPELIAGPNRARRQIVTLTPESTAVRLDGGVPVRGFRVVGPAGDATASVRLFDVAGRAGTIAPAPDQPIAVRFDVSGKVPEVSPLKSGWMLTTILELMVEPSVRAIAATDGSVLGDDFGRAPWTTVIERDTKPVVSAAALDGELLLQIGGAPDGLFAAAVVRAALNSRHGRSPYGEQEIARIGPATLTAFQRSAAPIDRDAWRQVRATDARWCWMLALVALLAEQWLRARSRRQQSQEVVRAAA